MFGFKKTKKEILIGQENYLAWRIDVAVSDFDILVLNIDMGYKCNVFVNGQSKDSCNPGRYELKSGQFDKNAKLTLLCQNVTKDFSMNYGMGNIPFEDFKTKKPYPIGIHGSIYYSVTPDSAYRLLTSFGKDILTESDIHNFYNEQLKVVNGEAGKMFGNKTFNELQQCGSEIAEKIKAKASALFKENLIVTNATANIHLPTEERASDIQKIKDKAEEDDERKKDLELIRAISESKAAKNAVTDRYATDKEEVKPSAKEVDYVLCCQCNNKNEKNAIYCKFCGKKLI